MTISGFISIILIFVSIATLSPDSLGKTKNKSKPVELEMCRHPDFFLTAIVPSQFAKELEQNCVYIVTPDEVIVVQSIKKGILVSAPQHLGNAPFRTAFIEGAKGYVDGDSPKPMKVKSAGTFDYTTVLGASSTIRKFKYLGDYK